jgi:hypothetical protein
MINYIDWEKREIHIPDYIPLHDMAMYLDTQFPYLRDFKIMIDGDNDSGENLEKEEV